MSNTHHRVEGVIERQTGRGPEGYLNECLRAFDWNDQIQLACDLEDEFDLEVRDYGLGELKTVEEIVRYIDSR